MAFFLLHLNTTATATTAAAAAASSVSTADADPRHTPMAAIIFPSAQLLRWHAVLGAFLALGIGPRPTTDHTDDPHRTVVMLTALRRSVMFPRCPRRRRTVFQPTSATRVTRVAGSRGRGADGEPKQSDREANAAQTSGGAAVDVDGPATATVAARVVPAALRGTIAGASSSTFSYRGEIVGQRLGGLLLELQGRCRLLLTHVPPLDLSVARPGAMVRGYICHSCLRSSRTSHT
jgi:hypothetical protein